MEDHDSYLQTQVNELQKRSAEIDQLKAERAKANAKRRVEQFVELCTKIEIARDHLVQAVFSIRNYNVVRNDPEHTEN